MTTALGMAPSQRLTLLDAADSYSWAREPENRLTEIFAVVLRASPELVAWLARRAFPTATEATAQAWTRGGYDVDTQHVLPTRERPDLIIRFDGPEAPPGRVVCENKIGADWTAAQRAGYEGLAPQDEVLLISPAEVPRYATRFASVSWDQIARAIFEIGRDWAHTNGSTDWRADALRPDAPSQFRLLAELLRYLQRENLGAMVADPFTAVDVDTFARAEAALGRAEALIRLVSGALGRDGIGKPQPWQTDGVRGSLSDGWSVTLGPANWPALDDFDLDWQLEELLLTRRITWEPGPPRDVPAFGVGVTISTEAGWPEGIAEGSPLRKAIDATDGIRAGTTFRGRRGRIFATCPLAAIAREDATLDQQAREVADWAEEQLQRIAQIAPAAE